MIFINVKIKTPKSLTMSKQGTTFIICIFTLPLIQTEKFSLSNDRDSRMEIISLFFFRILKKIIVNELRVPVQYANLNHNESFLDLIAFRISNIVVTFKIIRDRPPCPISKKNDVRC